jgi:hypothetical protein
MNYFRKTLTGVVLACATVATPSFAETLKAEGGSAGGLSALVPQLLSKYAADSHEVRVNVDQTLTRSALKVATGAIDIASTPSGAFAKMQVGKGPYKKLAEEAITASANIKSLFSYIGGHVHVIVDAESDIKSWDDLRGKRVYIGPPAGSFGSQAQGMIRAITGMESGTDYEGIKLAWGAANQAWADGKFDVFLRPGTMGSAAIDQFGSARPFRLLGIPADVIGTKAWDKFLETPGYAADTIPAGTYKNQANNDQDQYASAYVMFMSVNTEMKEQTAYDLTKAMFENLDDAHSVSGGLSPLTLNNAFVSLSAPLHPGALRYFDEVGANVPDHLR